MRAALAIASTRPMTISMAKYMSMKTPSAPEKPWSIMRRTATGTVSMAPAEATSATSATATMPG